MNICVIGSGYVGLVTGTCFAEFGVHVTCVDNNEAKIAALKRGEIPIYEPGLDRLVAKNVAEGRLHFTTDFAEGVRSSLVIFIAVGTPPGEDGSADLQYVEAVARQIAEVMDGYKVVVNKSTVPVGTARRVQSIMNEVLQGRHRFDVASNPEFLREGSAIEDFMRPNRVILGADDEHAVAILKDLYRPLYLIETPMVISNLETAEFTKYAANAFLATKISFINECANLCHLVGANVQDVAKGMGLDGRIGAKFLHPGPGYGGSCFPKDTLALTRIARDHDYRFEIVESVVAVNERQKQRALDLVLEQLGEQPAGKTVGLLGLAFKPNTDDMRESPTLVIVRGLQAAGVTVRAYDPAAMETAKAELSDIVYCEDAYDTAQGADCLVLATEWNVFRNLDLERLKDTMRSANFVDLRNVYNPKRVAEVGFKYRSLGRPCGMEGGK
jgi:UDPglucose 6-dehydrogenase